MANINLQQGFQPVPRKRSSGGGIFFSIFLLILAAGGYAGVKAFNKFTYVDPIEAKTQEIENIEGKFDAEDLSRAYDLSLRLEKMQVDTEMPFSVDGIQEVASVMVPGVFLEEFSYNQTEGKVDIMGIVASTEIYLLAQQASHIQDLNIFSSVELGDIEVMENEAGQKNIQFTLEATLNN